nr:hypothetical protein OG284_36400 [Streptomyces sp. NBC_01177]
MNSPGGLSGLAVVLDAADDAAHTHSALAAHDLGAGRVTLHPGPGTSGETALGHDLLAASGKPPQLPGGFPGGRQPVWEAATAWIDALPVTRLTVLRAHRLTSRRIERLLYLREATGIHLTLVLHRPRPTAALDRALGPVPHTVALTLAEARTLYYGGSPPPTPPVLQTAATPPAALPGPAAAAGPGTVTAAGRSWPPTACEVGRLLLCRRELGRRRLGAPTATGGACGADSGSDCCGDDGGSQASQEFRKRLAQDGEEVGHEGGTARRGLRRAPVPLVLEKDTAVHRLAGSLGRGQ